MKIKEFDLKNVLPKIKSLLLYGQDFGKINENISNIIKLLNVSKDNVFKYSANNISVVQDSIFTEALTNSMFGGTKLIVITDVDNSITNFIKELLAKSSVFICLVGENLLVKDSLRVYFEKNNDIAIMPCYVDDARGLEDFIRNYLFDNGIKQIVPEAMDYMIAHLGNDRSITRGFLDKIITYVYDVKIVNLQDVEDCIPDSGALSIDEFLYSLTAGEFSVSLNALERLLYNDIHPIFIIKKLRDHFNNLHIAVVRGIIPTIFYFKFKEMFNTSLKIWNEQEILNVFTRISKLEETTRYGTYNIDLFLRYFVLSLSLRAFKLRGKLK